MTASDGVSELASARLGTVLGKKYRLDRVLGEGGMAVVYAATHRNGIEVAVKVLRPDLSRNHETRARFLREGQATNAVKHPGVVRVLDDDIAEDGSAFLVMEMLLGETLEELWMRRARPMRAETVLELGFQICDVLAAAHAKGIIHRDMKPANIFITSDGELKVLDFGIARVRDELAIHTTSTGIMMGTPAFMAPEQAAGEAKHIGPPTDVFAVGATLFSIAAGCLPQEGDNGQQLVIQRATTQARSLAAVLPDAPPAMVQVIDRALAFARGDRWAGAAEMRDAIAAAYLASFGVAPPVRQYVVPPDLASRPGADVGASRPGTDRTEVQTGAAIAAKGTNTTMGPVASSPITQGEPSTVRAPASRRAISAFAPWALTTLLLVAGSVVFTYQVLRVPTSATTNVAAQPPMLPPPPPTPQGPPPSAVQAPTAAPPSSAEPTKSRTKSAAGVKVDCTPPYTIDSSGTHHWKLECL